MATTLGRIFDSGVVNDIKVVYDEVESSGLTEPVGTTAFTLKNVSIDANKANLKVFDLAASLGAQASASVSIDAPSTTITPFDASAPLAAPANSSYAVLHIDGKLSAAASGNIASVPLAISAGAADSFAYDHYLPVAATENRAAALTRLVASAQLPQFENLTTLQAGEISSFRAALNFDLGIKARWGTSFDLQHVLDLFDGLSAQLTARVQYSLEASLGWSLYDDMDYVVARAQTTNADWVRIHIDRAHKDTFTAGATFALQVDYDASSLATALEKAFELSPLPRAIGILTTVSTTTWDQVKAQVTDRASAELISLIAGTGWKEKAANSPEVTAALADINKAVSLYNGVDAKVQQLWSSLLLKAGAAPGTDLRRTIDTIAALDPKNPNLEQFLSPTARKDLDMLESLTGRSVEQLLVGSSVGTQTAIAQAVSLAKQLQSVITNTPAKIEAALQKFAQSSGVKGVIEWLSANATSLDAIQQSGDREIQKLVAKAVDKTFGSVTPKDVQVVQNWAGKILAEWDDLSAKLAAAAKFLQGTAGFNVSLEYSRASELSAMLDFELDPANEAAVRAVSAQLAKGSVRDMLAALDAIDADHQGNLPYTIRDSILVSRHVRSSATTVLLSLVGLQRLQKVTGSRFEESIVHVSDSGRTATISGGFTQAIAAGNATSECGVWVETDAVAPTKDVAQPFATTARTMRLTFARSDRKASAEELGALRTLLDDLGFTQTDGATLDAPKDAETTFSLDISLDESALKVFAADDGEENWNKDYRNAAYRLLRDDMITEQLASVGQPIGEVLAAVVATDDFGATWTDPSMGRFVNVVSEKGFAVSGRTLRILNDQRQIVPPYIPVRMMITRRPRGLSGLQSVGNALQSTSLLQRDLERLSAGAAAMFANTALPEWDNPMFNFWFVVARLVRLAGQGTNVLKTATGLATFRYRPTASAPLTDPLQWSLTPDVGVSVKVIAARRLFPFA